MNNKTKNNGNNFVLLMLRLKLLDYLLSAPLLYGFIQFINSSVILKDTIRGNFADIGKYFVT